MLFRSQADDLLEVWDGGDGEVFPISLSEFSQVSALRWSAQESEVLVTAVSVDGARPDPRNGKRGDLRLFRCQPVAGRWEQVSTRYAHDPVCIPGGYAVHNGSGLTLIDRSGRVDRDVKVGRFSWGPPSLAINAAGDRVAWTRWVGDDAKVHVESVADGTSFRGRSSVYRYGWWDDSTLVYYLGSGLRLLDVMSGRSRAVALDLRRAVVEQLDDGPSELTELATADRDSTWESFDDLRVDDQNLWFVAQLAHRDTDRPSRVQALYRWGRTTGLLTLSAWVGPDEKIEDFAVLPDCSAVLTVALYDQLRVVARERRSVGPSCRNLDAGWVPALDSRTPTFGFHQLPS